MTSSGRKVGQLEATGDTILHDYCQEFPKPSPDRSNHVLPPYFLSKYPEMRDPGTNKILPNPQRVFTKKDCNRLHGIETGQTGEIAEHDVYKMIYDLSCKPQAISFLAIHNFELDTEGKLKESTLRSELPAFPVGVNLNIELDFVVFQENHGIVAIEVKSTGSADSIAKAEKQLYGGQNFLSALMSTAASHSTTATLPYVRVICVPNDASISSCTKTPQGTYRLNRDIISQPNKFQRMWNIFVKDLLSMKTASTFSNDDFSRFTKIAVGLWSCKQTPVGLDLNRYKASKVTGIKEADERVEKGMLSSNTKTNTLPLSNVVFNEPHETPRKCQQLELIYFTVEQKSLYDCHPQTLVRGPAGSGKSILILMKIIDLFGQGTANKSLLIAKEPFIFKCEQILQANGLSTHITKEFPLKPTVTTPITNLSSSSITTTVATPIPHPTAKVVIMGLDDFFKVPLATLQQYDISSYSIFIDDLQGHSITEEEKEKGYAHYGEIADYINNLYLNRIYSQLHLWVCFDMLQSIGCEFDDKWIPSLLYINPTTPRPLNITT